MAQRRYTCTNQSNSNARPFTLAISRFSVSGDTTSTVATINSLKVTHYHTATGGKSHQWTCWVVMTFNNGNTITSDQVTHHTGEDKNYCPAWVNTFSNVSAANVQSGIASIEIQATPNSGNYSLYWRATSSYPVTIDLDFGTYVPTAPTITTARFTNANFIYGGVTFPIFQHVESCDSKATISARSLRLYNNSGFDVTTNVTATSPTSLPPIQTIGTLTWVYTIIDSYGQSANTSGQIIVMEYRPPRVVYFTVNRRDGFNNIADLTVRVVALSGNDLTTVKITRWEEGSSSKTSVLNVTVEDSTVYVNNSISTIGLSSGSRYYFELAVSDGIQTTVQREVLNGTFALFDIEKNGVAVGKLASRGTTTTPAFEIAMPSYFTEHAILSSGAVTGNFTVNGTLNAYGGINGLIHYTTGTETSTGNTWGNNTIYRYIWTGTFIPDGSNLFLFSLPSTPLKLISIQGTMQDQSSYTYYQLPGSVYSYFTVNGSTVNFITGSALEGKTLSVTVIVEYTKSGIV